MLERLSKTWRNVGLVAVAVVLVWGGWSVRNVLNPLILGYLLAYILRPYVLRLEGRGLGRRMAVNIIFSLFAMVLTATLIGVAVQAQHVAEAVLAPNDDGEDPVAVAERRINHLLGGTKEWIDGIFGDGEPTPDDEPSPDGEPGPDGEPSPDREGADGEREGGDAQHGDGPEAAGTPDAGGESAASGQGQVAPPDGGLTIRRLLRSWAADLSSQVEDSGGPTALFWVAFGVLMRVFGGVLSIFGFLVLLPVYTYFLLFELERIHDFLRSHVPKKERERVTRIGRQIGDVVANFFRGRLLICFLKGAFIALGLGIAGVPHAFLLGMTSGFLALVPFVGPTIGFVVTYIFGLQAMEVVEAALWIAPVFVIAEALEGYILIPKILGDSLGLHPVVILVAIFVGGSALGLSGFLIAVPLAATAIILFRELIMPAVEDFAEEDSHVDEEPSPPA